jgi:hypothetical protein
MQTFSILRPSEIYPNWDFWFENVASGNPALSAPENGCRVSACTGFLSNEFPNSTSETIKARSFLLRKNIFVFCETL